MIKVEPYTEIKTCPFCGKQPTAHGWKNLFTDKTRFTIECHNYWCDFNPKTPAYLTRAEAVKAWNKRG